MKTNSCISNTLFSTLTGAFLILILISVLSSCSKNETSPGADSFHEQFTAPIEKAHQAERWLEKGSIKTDIHIKFGGNTVIEATMHMQTSTGKTRLDVDENISAAFDGNDVWIAPNDTALARADFHVLTWSYFLAIPYKLNDPGTILEDRGIQSLGNKTYDTAMLTFEEGTGDTPDDWYLIYRNQETDMLYALAYIITYGKTSDEANQDPHAITYEDFETIDGVPVSTTWKFWGWDEETGLSEQQTGEGILSNIEFVEVPEGFYQQPN